MGSDIAFTAIKSFIFLAQCSLSTLNAKRNTSLFVNCVVHSACPPGYDWKHNMDYHYIINFPLC